MGKNFTIHDLPKEERPRERLLNLGERALSSQELLQVILGRGVAGESVAVTAQKIIAQFGSLEKLAEASIAELSQIKGIGPAKATQIKAVFEIGRRVNSPSKELNNKEITSPQAVCSLINNKIKDYNKEHFYLISLNSRNHSVSEVSIGTINSNLVHPREVFGEAIKAKAVSVIFVHNHPSGDTEPSHEDITITKRLAEAGKIMGIDILDHIIISKKQNPYSFKENKLI
jgi:DNA repair protein RadC